MRPPVAFLLKTAAVVALVAGYVVGSTACGPIMMGPPKAEAWCDITAVACVTPKLEACCVGVGSCLTMDCSPSGFDPICVLDSDCIHPIGCLGVACDGLLETPESVINPATCARTTASVPMVGDRVCFPSGTPAAACQGYCSAFGTDLNINLWPTTNNLRNACTSLVNTNATAHPGLVGGEIPMGCMDPGPPTGGLASQGTNLVAVTGSGTASINGGPGTPIMITGGYFDIAAPKTSCTALDTTCPTQINQAQVDFSNFTLDGHTVDGMQIYLDAQVVTASGVLSGSHFLFTIPQNTTFDAIATVDGMRAGLTVSSTQEVNGSLNLATGEIAFQFNLSGTFFGKTLEATGMATSSSVLAQAPVVTAGAITVVDSPHACTATVTIAATASSAAGLPVTIAYYVDSQIAGTGASATATVSIGASHSIRIVGTDTNGMSATVNESVSPTDNVPPVIACPGTQTLECTNEAAVATFETTASDNCGAPTVVCTPPSGSSFSEDGSPHNDSCTATDSSGNSASCNFQVDVVDTLPPAVTISNDGSGYSGTQWPPNHTYVAHSLADCVTGQAVDQCDGALGIGAVGKIVRITSDEPENAPGDGNTCADMVITGPTTFELRTERSGKGDGRVYTVEFTVSDDDNNAGTQSCSFQVPHDQGGRAAVAGAAVYCVGTNCGGLPGNDPSCK